MRILHITTVRTGSTGRTATDLKTLLTQKGEHFKIAFSEPDANPKDGDILIGNKLDHKVHAFFSRMFGLQGYFSYFATKRFLRQVKAYNPDLVQLGNLHANFINLPLLFRYLAIEKIPVVIILHDCWFITGKCTHFTELKCDRWKTECHCCPALKMGNKSWFFDWTRKMFNDRKQWYESLSSLTVVAVSDWEKNQALQSPLLQKAKVTRIYNWIDTNTFKPAELRQIEAVLSKYGLSSGMKYVISVGAGWSADSIKTKDAIRLSALLQDNYHLIIVGRGDTSSFPESVIRIPYTSDASELSVLYSLSCAYIHFSVEDTFGKVIAEAMSCGTVPIVFNSTACPETASPYGLVVPPHDVEAMVSVIPTAEEPERRSRVREYVLEHYAQPLNMAFYWGGE